MSSSECIAYLAGFFDGEGSISFNTDHRSGYQYYDLRIGQTVEKPLYEYVKMFGGKIYKRTQLTRGGKPYYTYRVVDQDLIVQILICLYPHLIVKEEKAQAVLDRFGLSVPDSNEDVLNGYFAGMFDAEGSINIDKRKCSGHVRVRQNLEHICRLFQAEFGGGVYQSVTQAGNSTFEWRLPISSLERFSNNIRPYLILKRGQFDLFYEMSKITGVRMDSCDPVKREWAVYKFMLAKAISDMNN